MTPELRPSPWADKPLNADDIEKDSEERVKKSQWVAHVLRRKEAENQVAGLELLTLQTPILYNFHEGQFKPTVEVRMKFVRPGWRAFFGKMGPEIPLDSENEASVFLFLKANVSDVDILIRGPNNEEQSEKIYVYAPEVRELKFASPWNKVVIGLGGGVLNYYQTVFGQYRSGNAIASLLYSPDSLWDKFSLIAKTDFTFSTFYSTPIHSGAQLLDVRLDGTYQLSHGFDPTYRWYSIVGVSYLTMFSNGSPFGFADLAAPEVGLRLRALIDPSNFLIGEARFSFFGTFDFGQRGLQGSITWSRWMENLRRLDLTLEYTSAQWEADSQTSVRTDMVSLKLGMSL